MRQSMDKGPQRVTRGDSVEVRIVGHDFGGAMLYRVDPGVAAHADLIGKPVGSIVGFAFEGTERCAPGTIVAIKREKRGAVPPISDARQRLL